MPIGMTGGARRIREEIREHGQRLGGPYPGTLGHEGGKIGTNSLTLGGSLYKGHIGLSKREPWVTRWGKTAHKVSPVLGISAPGSRGPQILGTPGGH